MRITPPTPLHAVPGFLPALQRARLRRPDVRIDAWRTIASMYASPVQCEVTAAQLVALANELVPRKRGTA